METLHITKEAVIGLLLKNITIKMCSGLWNDPQKVNTVVKSAVEIYEFYKNNCWVEVKKFENDPAIYLHGYSNGDMF